MSRRYNPHHLFNGSFIPEWLERRKVKEISLGAKLIFARLTRYAGKDGKCFPKIDEISQATGICKRQVNHYIKELKNLKLIESIQVGKKCSNRYYFLEHPWMIEAMYVEVQDSSSHSKSEVRNPASPVEVRNPASPQKENQGRESSLNKYIKISKDLKGKKPPAKNIFLIKKKENKNMAVNYKCDTSQKCQFVHQAKEFGDSGYCCTNNAQMNVKVKDENGKKFDFEVCPRHERMIANKKSFKYFKNLLTLVE